ncbi:Glycosyltransferase [archaeon GW2011_AR15]|nr:Glycosyltransferase [archaeon GW2011_AR15]MBS3103572.1 glycosyltransferase family 4 protein [Candidatus Woesearchaeota archaeon]
MKVLMVSEYFPPESRGGGEISAFLLARELSKEKGIEVHVLTSHFPGLKKEETLEKVKIHRLLKTGRDPNTFAGNLRRMLFFERSLLKQLKILHKQEKFGIIHCMNASSAAAVKLKKKLNVPFVLHVNGPVLFCPKGTLMYKDKEICDRKCTRLVFLDCYMNSENIGKMRLNFFSRLNPGLIYTIRRRFETYQKHMDKFDFYMPISNYMRKRLLMAGIEPGKIKTIYNIAEFDRFLKLKQPRNKIPKILYLGEYSKPKGAHLLVEALKGIKEKYVCNFYGSGVLRDTLEKQVNENNLSVKINDKVSYSEIPKIMEKHDILVYPSAVGEAFGRAVLEACAAGKLVLASDIGGIPDIINSKTGFLFRAGDANELRSLLQKALKKEISVDIKKIRQEIKKKFAAKHIKKDVAAVYKRLK